MVTICMIICINQNVDHLLIGVVSMFNMFQHTRVVQKLSGFSLFLNQPSSAFIILMKIIQIICGYMALILQGPWIFMIIC